MLTNILLYTQSMVKPLKRAPYKDVAELKRYRIKHHSLLRAASKYINHKLSRVSPGRPATITEGTIFHSHEVTSAILRARTAARNELSARGTRKHNLIYSLAMLLSAERVYGNNTTTALGSTDGLLTTLASELSRATTHGLTEANTQSEVIATLLIVCELVMYINAGCVRGDVNGLNKVVMSFRKLLIHNDWVIKYGGRDNPQLLDLRPNALYTHSTAYCYIACRASTGNVTGRDTALFDIITNTIDVCKEGTPRDAALTTRNSVHALYLLLTAPNMRKILPVNDIRRTRINLCANKYTHSAGDVGVRLYLTDLSRVAKYSLEYTIVDVVKELNIFIEKSSEDIPALNTVWYSHSRYQIAKAVEYVYFYSKLIKYLE